MESNRRKLQLKPVFRLVVLMASLAVLTGYHGTIAHAAGIAPAPLLEGGHPVDWWFVFKFNSKAFPDCGAGVSRQCFFGGDVQDYKAFGQQFVYASSEKPSLKKGSGCAGETTADPIGATFDQVYNGSFHYVIWNDQFYDDPKITGCTKDCGAPWGHSKGMLAWNESGEGLVMQVTTPSWPAAGNKDYPRKTDGNTLGCVRDDNVEVSQHFFAVKLAKDDLVNVLQALHNASVVTDPKNPQIVNNGGPADVQKLVEGLGKKSDSTTPTKMKLTSGWNWFRNHLASMCRRGRWFRLSSAVFRCAPPHGGQARKSTRRRPLLKSLAGILRLAPPALSKSRRRGNGHGQNSALQEEAALTSIMRRLECQLLAMNII